MLRGQYLLGYDARKWAYERFSTPEDREAFLFRLDVERVLSVDEAVWPSVFPLDRNVRPDCVGFFQNLWEDLDSLRSQIANTTLIPTRRAEAIAVTLQIDTFNAEEVGRWERRLKGVSPNPGITDADLSLPHASPSSVGSGWSLLGHDVCDEWGLSGLANCGFQPDREDVRALRATWAPRLNASHLFDSIDHAVEFALLSNQRVSEHAPFFVYGLWRVEELKT
jgi:hypothetical protein